MKRPIKFRARDAYGEVFYGSFDEDTCTIDCWDIAETVVVERDTVAQLVGYDVDGREVYEGDTVIGEYGDEVVARLMDNLPPKCTLKGDSDETPD